MKYNRIESGRLFLLLGALLIGQAAADPFNGSFEISHPIYDSNLYLSLLDPNGWETTNYVTAAKGFRPADYPGTKGSWLIDTDVNMPAFKGDYLLVLSTGDDSIEYSEARQEVRIRAGDKIKGTYFFGACDYRPFNDWAEIKLVPRNNPNGNVIMLASAGVDMLGDYGSFAGLKKFEYTIGPEEGGDYDLVLFISDEIDTRLESYLVVDGINICRYNQTNPPADYGDLNCDCTVNYDDMLKLAHDWGLNCNDEATLDDPNCNCLIGSDIDGSGPVDFNDIRIMSENWLFGIKNN
jgi:hypothetical protein